MTDQEIPSNTQGREAWSTYNTLAVSFADDRNAYKGLNLLKQLDTQARVVVQEAVVVVREEGGAVVEKDRVESTFMPATAGGGLIGLLIGIIGGPLGILIGGAGGLYAGALFDIHDAAEIESALAGISTSVRVGHTALLAVVTEQSPEVVDAAMAGLGGSVQRRSVSDVEAEVAATEKAERKAKSEAHRELIRGRQRHDKVAISAKIAELKGKLSTPLPSRPLRG